MYIRSKTNNPIEATFFALGTINRIKIYDNINESILDAVIDRVNEIDDRMSAYKPESDISIIRQNAGETFTNIHQDTFALIKRGVKYGKMSNGLFDITAGPLTELWRINKKEEYIPSDADIQKKLRLVNYKDIVLDKKAVRAALRKKGQAIDLGGIAKGFAADEVRRILKANGVKCAMINLGGNVITIGSRIDGKPWKVGIQNPLAPTGHYIGVISEKGKTVVTSGANEQYFIKDGIRYHHILNPHTGKPVENKILSVTVIHTSSIAADALSTILFILGPELSKPLIQKLNIKAVFIQEDLSLIVTPSLQKDSFVTFTPAINISKDVEELNDIPY